MSLRGNPQGSGGHPHPYPQQQQQQQQQHSQYQQQHHHRYPPSHQHQPYPHPPPHQPSPSSQNHNQHQHQHPSPVPQPSRHSPIAALPSKHNPIPQQPRAPPPHIAARGPPVRGRGHGGSHPHHRGGGSGGGGRGGGGGGNKDDMGLPPNILALFTPRPPLEYKEPMDKPKLPPLSGVGNLVDLFEDPKDAPEGEYRPPETRRQRRERIQREKEEQRRADLEAKRKQYDPLSDPKASKDPRRTLFVGRLNYDTKESKLEHEFEEFGPIRNIRIVHDPNTQRSRGYAFIEFESERDMHAARRYGDGKVIDGYRILVDRERGRDPGWLPRRLGQGKGPGRIAKTPAHLRMRERGGGGRGPPIRGDRGPPFRGGDHRRRDDRRGPRRRSRDRDRDWGGHHHRGRHGDDRDRFARGRERDRRQRERERDREERYHKSRDERHGRRRRERDYM